ncbi:TetR/AcrR family transcriptional regulator [Mycolicibacterium lacusdiani]|uniref:TetR/AcrR family transcriptional regulator n=1 Tax=Mycolicibacterium lacusdiani TaxID=2895283 RepID=UPI001F187DE5|nr:TetR/AcrR family transcriptional regulator [Mycolicibacterium lacusdiani]
MPFPRRPATAEPSSVERIRDAALECFASTGIAATSLRTVAESAGVSVGSVQHHFGTKAALVESVNDHVLKVISGTVASSPLTAADGDPLTEAGARLISMISSNAFVVDYLARALIEGDEFGAEIFDGLLALSTAQREQFAAQDLLRPEQDMVWAALNPLVLRLGAMLLRSHIERHLPGPLTEPDQLRRWDAAVTALIRRGQFRDSPPH